MMRRIYNRITAVRHQLTFASGLVALVLSLGLAGVVVVPKVSAAQDCDSNAVIYCGFSSASDFISTVRNNDSKNGHHDLQTIYAAYGLEPASYDKFVSSALPGTAYKDGTIKVSGVTVATGAQSIGRSSKSYSHPKTIAGAGTFYESRAQDVFKSDSIPVTVLFNDKGVMQFAVLQSCGNPIQGTNVVPNYSCNALHMDAVAGKLNTYSFMTDATANNNASFAKFVYDFGDGTSATVTNPTTPVVHTFSKAGTYTAKVTTYVNLPNVANVAVVSGNCQKTVTVTLPYYQCLQLAGAILDKSKFSYQFVATAKFGNGATFTSADFDTGDGQNSKGVKPNADGTTATLNHTYAKAGNYSVSAVLHFSVNGADVTAPTCSASVTPTTPPTPECKPGVPVGDARCTPCQYDNTLPSNSPQCVAPAPPVLPNTGAGNVVAIFGAVAVGGFMIYRQLLFRKHRAAFAAAERGTSPLPLGQPLDDMAPLAGTPLAPKRRSFRRNRPF